MKTETEVIIGNYTYIIKDERPKLNEYYIDVFAVDHARSVQIHTEIRHIKNHKKDYRWQFCCKIINSNDPDIINTLNQPKQP